MGENPDRLHPEERGLDRVRADSPATQHLSPICLERDAVLSSVYRGVSDKQSKRVKMFHLGPRKQESHGKDRNILQYTGLVSQVSLRIEDRIHRTDCEAL